MTYSAGVHRVSNTSFHVPSKTDTKLGIKGRSKGHPQSCSAHHLPYSRRTNLLQPQCRWNRGLQLASTNSNHWVLYGLGRDWYHFLPLSRRSKSSRRSSFQTKLCLAVSMVANSANMAALTVYSVYGVLVVLGTLSNWIRNTVCLWILPIHDRHGARRGKRRALQGHSSHEIARSSKGRLAKWKEVLECG